MKTSCLFVIASLVVLAVARADLTIVQKIDGAEGLREVTMEVKGDKARVEVNPQVTTIVDAKTGEVTNILNDKKMVMRISGEQSKKMAEMAKSFVKEEAPDQQTPKATGKTEVINGHETKEYVTDSPKFHASYWVATDYPNAQEILTQMAVLRKGAFASLTQGMPDYRMLPGLPLRTVIKIPDQPEITSTIESVSTASLPDTDFTAPAGYSEMKMPDMFGKPDAGTQPKQP